MQIAVNMNELITVIKADDVSDDYKKEAKEWIKWDSKARKKFPYNYKIEERILILEGSATLTPETGDPIEINAGDQVTFHKGFKCKWAITKRMKKHYAVFPEEGADDDDEEDAPAITCDICDADCVAESYFIKKEEQDICVECYEKDQTKYEGAEHQKNGEKWVEPKAKATKAKAKTPKKKNQKTKAKK